VHRWLKIHHPVQERPGSKSCRFHLADLIMAKLTLANVSKTYSEAERAALNDINLEIRDREFAVLAGPPSCGKSSLLRVIAGLEKVSTGDILIDERRINDLPAKRRDLAMVFPNSSLYPRMTNYDNVAIGLKLRNFGTREIRQRVTDAAAVLGIENLLKQKPTALSFTQQQQVALARAIARQPKILLLDDPFVRLSDADRAELRGEMTRVHQRLQTTIIYATDDPTEAMILGDTVIILNNGAVEQTDRPHAAYNRPVNLFVAGFLGRPMNLVRGELRQEREGLVFCEENEGTIKIRLPATEQLRARDLVGKPLILGIRPTEIEVAGATTANDDSMTVFPAIVELVESKGVETDLYLQTGAHRLICHSQRPLDRHEAGHRMRFKIAWEKVSLFDPVSKKRLSEVD
jgi:multiple sugar transport system ATP-binding protein